METKETHIFFMKHCIKLGKAAKALNDSPVGAIIVKDGKVIAEGIEASKSKHDVTCHAEIEAIRDIIKKLNITDLSGYTMYTTHEPCIMCSYAIRHHKISEIVWGISTGEIGGYSSKFNILQDTTIQKWGNIPNLISGVLEDACKELHK